MATYVIVSDDIDVIKGLMQGLTDCFKGTAPEGESFDDANIQDLGEIEGKFALSITVHQSDFLERFLVDVTSVFSSVVPTAWYREDA